ncbi:uncharacterized protein LOC132611670 [Lycium barbarum]|uniref:uncharacterized protein LOC132611670 n=1 Tax=Lycium barbarum TaxID=112863 RepID=UPI00293F2413|nr:uncharacterized protein LOC132611670 [Lycium barbarum]
MESDSSGTDLTHINQELPMNVEEKLKLSDKEDAAAAYDYSDISLRLLHFSQGRIFTLFITDDNISKFCSCDTFLSKKDATRYIADVVMPHPWYGSICLNGKPIGSITVSAFGGSDFRRGIIKGGSNRCRAKIGYKLASKYWGKGIATKAVKMAAATILVDWTHLARLEAVVDVKNPASQRVLEKVGFTKEGVFRKYYLLNGKPRDMVMLSLLSTDPQLHNLAPDICSRGKSSYKNLFKGEGRGVDQLKHASLFFFY